MSTTSTNGNGNGTARSVWTAVIAAISTVAVMAGIMAAFINPIHKDIDNINSRLDKVESWQQEYMKGKIPSSAEPELSAIKVKFTEVETQFKWFNQIADERLVMLEKQIEELRNKK